MPTRVRLAGEVIWTYLQVRRLMDRHDIVTVVSALRDGSGDRLDPESARRIASRLGRPVWRTLAPLPADSRCLVRSLVVLRMMARRGVRCDLSIGARPGTEFAAHAWVELNGDPVLPTLGYAPLTTI
ncbi:MAG TPA: lasso peptide biosynthesis B2 protein [Solirubrobacteraceae bacterium]